MYSSYSTVLDKINETITAWFFVYFLFRIIISFIASASFQGIAEEKGYVESSKYFWWCLLVPIFGIPMVIALPDKKLRETQSNIERILRNIKDTNNEPNKSDSKSSDDELPTI